MALMALILPAVLVPLVGLAIDGTMCYVVQAKLAAAADGAALGAGRLLGTAADPAEIAGEFLSANFQTGVAGFWGANNMQQNITYTSGTTKVIQVDASVDVPLLFLRVIGKTKSTVTATAIATRRDSRMVLVIDRSGSMTQTQSDGNTAIADVVSYAQGFTQNFTPGTDEVGLVVYDGSAVVGYPTTRPWDSTTTSTSTGGPDTSFLSKNGASCCDMIWQIKAINAANGTNTAEALWMAYIELQKTHMRDLAANSGVDTRLNSIVLFTDGFPTAVTVDLNNSGWSAMATSSPCNNKNAWPSPKMMGWIAVSGTPPFGVSTLPDTRHWPNLLASTDPNTSDTANWWMSHAGSDWVNPNPTTPYSGCSGLYGGSTASSSALVDINGIPSKDAYGNSMGGTSYTNSQVVDDTGSVVTPNPVYSGTALDLTQKASAYHWGLAMWNSVYNTANNIRSDSNLANRSGDTTNMSIAIYTIGYLGNGGLDQGLLRAVSNDKSSATYNSAQPTGMFVPATNPTALANAFTIVASAILRLRY
jgi:hypothetical protein